jgi:hypothetical protein
MLDLRVLEVSGGADNSTHLWRTRSRKYLAPRAEVRLRFDGVVLPPVSTPVTTTLGRGNSTQHIFGHFPDRLLFLSTLQPQNQNELHSSFNGGALSSDKVILFQRSGRTP